MAVSVEWIKAPTFSAAPEGGMQATLEVRIAWGDVDDFLEEKLGSEFVGGQEVARFDFDTLPGKSWMVLDRLTVAPFDPANIGALDINGLPTCGGGARCTLTYKTKPYDQSSQSGGGESGSPDDPDKPDEVLLEHSVSASIRVLTHSLSALEWDLAGDGDAGKVVPDDIQAGIREPIMEHRLTWNNVPLPPWETIRNTLGKVNSAVFLGHPVQTVLFSSCNANKTVNVNGDNKWKLTYAFDVRMLKAPGNVEPAGGGGVQGDDPGWNHFLRANGNPAHGAWQVVRNKSGSLLMPEASFDPELFQFAAQ